MPQLFLDCDGVLADFDSYAQQIFGLPPRQAEEQLGTRRFWVDLSTHPNFYFNLPLMPDAMDLYNAVKHMSPIILTGLPEGDWAEPQKRAWGEKYFPGVKMICCKSKHKRDHMQPGDILIDDWPRYKDRWEEKGGVFILHRSARQSLEELAAVLNQNSYLQMPHIAEEVFAFERFVLQSQQLISGADPIRRKTIAVDTITGL